MRVWLAVWTLKGSGEREELDEVLFNGTHTHLEAVRTSTRCCPPQAWRGEIGGGVQGERAGRGPSPKRRPHAAFLIGCVVTLLSAAVARHRQRQSSLSLGLGLGFGRLQ